jgi:hypothetical protein
LKDQRKNRRLRLQENGTIEATEPGAPHLNALNGGKSECVVFSCAIHRHLRLFAIATCRNTVIAADFGSRSGPGRPDSDVPRHG